LAPVGRVTLAHTRQTPGSALIAPTFRLAGFALDVPPTKALGRGRQTFAFPHMLDLPGR